MIYFEAFENLYPYQAGKINLRLTAQLNVYETTDSSLKHRQRHRNMKTDKS